MNSKILSYTIILLLILTVSCNNASKKQENVQETEIKKDTVTIDSTKITKKEPEFKLTEENAIPFFFEYNKTLTENKVKITTNLGSFTLELFENVPYHRANFIYLTKKGYFNDTYFHRVVKNFIIQGGNADNIKTSKKRSKIGRYLLPPDTKKGHKHHRGVISMPSSENDNPHKLASPYEFFIVVTKPGSYHLDGDYTPFGRVIQGMDVVDIINSQPVDEGDWPKQNIFIIKAEVVK
ncbi:peptidylprolyl isomerase [Cellulophaga sp. 20_2_10]|uniref:peptidylprolyl isomerase n=1 Tax=Cellulophaga sp. 20_2_10 TaxID=2942476 RepID=UPI00201AC9EF|nr:peptidylprolyl isomerase [Cellulophaga sp. 20_2_10]MCL5245998.1 peptidylprolyl isomerase [Cellulophaga sp. 20_2_10]